MNVSITEDATMSRTRSEGGATVVLVDAIASLPASLPAIHQQRTNFPSALWLSLFPNHFLVNGNIELARKCRETMGYSSPKSSLPSSKKLITTTTADPARPQKNKTSRTRIPIAVRFIRLIVAGFQAVSFEMQG
jgi:hypothetical protein